MSSSRLPLPATVLAVLAILLPAPAGEPVDWSGQFQALRASVREGVWYSDRTNEDGTLGWSESYVLVALLSHYIGSGDVASLDLLVEHGERIWANRDDRRGVVDAFRGKAVAGWGATKYSKGKRYVWAVHTGMLVHPMAEFCGLVEERKELGERFGETASRWKPRILECIRVFDGQWREGPGEGEGHYVGLALGGAVLPQNMMNALGRAMLSVSRWSDAPPFALERGRKLLRFFKNRLTHVPDGDCYDWAYAAVKGRGEDISHAAINVDFAAQGAARDLVFDEKDMGRFANTFLNVVRRSADEFAVTVSGTGKGNRYAGTIPRWLALSRWDRRVHATVAAWYRKRMKDGRLSPSLNHLLAAGLLCRYR